MKKCFYLVFSVLVILALSIAGVKYWQEYSFKRDLSRLINTGIQLDAYTTDVSKAVARGIAYQMSFPEVFLEEGQKPEDFLQETAAQFAQGAIQKDDIIKQVNDALLDTKDFKDPQDEAYAKAILFDDIGNKAQTLANNVAQFQQLQAKLLYSIKEEELPLDALFWGNEIKEDNISSEQLSEMSKNWIGDEKQNARLVALAAKYAQNGKARPLTEKEQAVQAYYNNRIGLVLNPVLQDKKQIAALTPEVCTDLMARYWAEQINSGAITLDALQEAQKDWAKDDTFKNNFMQNLTGKIKENKPSGFTYLETLQLNTCNNM